MRFGVLTLFPEIFSSFLSESLINRAIKSERIRVDLYNYRQHGLGKHRKVDDTPFGGGAGMLLRVEPIYHALMALDSYYKKQYLQTYKILLTPQGMPFDQERARKLSTMERVLLLVCGRYEGFDERIRSYVDEEISGGDFVCLGGEVIAMLMIEVISRLVPDVIGNSESSREESFTHGLLEYPQYTRPGVFNEERVPEVLVSGNHQQIENWRKEQSLMRTRKQRPDLLKEL